MNKNITFAGELRKNNIRYYFEIKEAGAYIEKSTLQDKVLDYRHFTIEQARKCYKALLTKGFKPLKDKELHYDAYTFEERFTIDGMKQICCSKCPFKGQCDDHKVVKCAAWKCLPHTPGALDKSIVDLYWSVAVHMDAELGYLDPEAPPIIPQSLKASR